MVVLKVVFITHYVNLYGANRSLLNLIDGLKHYNVEPFVVAPSEGKISDALRTRNVQFATIPIQYWVGSRTDENHSGNNLYQTALYRREATKRLYKNLKILPSLKNQLQAWNVDIVYTNSSVTPVGALVARMLKIPHVWHLREFIDIDYNFHHDWGKTIFNYFLSQADAQIAISESIRSHFISGLSPERVHVIYNGIASIADFDRFFKIRNSIISNDKPYTFALIGLIHPNKGQDVAIKALSILVKYFSQVRLLIVGHGDNTKLKKLAEDLGVANKVEFWGHVDDPYKAYLASDVVLMCSKNEGMGRVTVEAMSACRPVIGYDNAGTSEIIQHEYTGMLYQGGHEELAICMRRFVENPAWAKQLGENAWHVARKEYSIEMYSKRIYEVLLSILAKKSEKSKYYIKH
ncbi:hypothetical protein A6770_27695 [Nostoc minutum NIES-26]|uniref:Glycosyl transferase n=1 Tax=Nostoc minutum NIES-26 TaxID=1844469 RepID=A0A367QNZ6_9NOSO|nr:hypothetical protein A6770_27695 [Nostoc minutum NIES-26]